MKITKIFLFTLLAIFSLGFVSNVAQAFISPNDSARLYVTPTCTILPGASTCYVDVTWAVDFPYIDRTYQYYGTALDTYPYRTRSHFKIIRNNPDNTFFKNSQNSYVYSVTGVVESSTGGTNIWDSVNYGVSTYKLYQDSLLLPQGNDSGYDFYSWFPNIIPANFGDLFKLTSTTTTNVTTTASCTTGTSWQNGACRGPAPIINSVSVSPNPVPYGATTTISYNASNANDCHIFLDWNWNYSKIVYANTGSYTTPKMTSPGSHTASVLCGGNLGAAATSWTTTVFTVNNAPVNGGWSAWSGFGACSLSCGGGSQSQSRTCTNPTPAYGGASCSGSSTQSRACNTQACTCSAPLTQNVTVACDTNAYGYSATSGSVTRSQTKSAYPGCTFPSPVTTSNSTYVANNCAYPAVVNGGWSAWNTPSAQCGYTGTQTRTCTNPAPLGGGASCVGSSTQSYTNPACPINGGWSAWGSFGACSLSCGGGSQSQSRTCTNPTPAYGGTSCSGSSTQSQACNTQACVCSTPLTQTQSVSCPYGYTGSITQTSTKSAYPGCTFGGWVETSRNCTAIPPITVSLSASPAGPFVTPGSTTLTWTTTGNPTSCTASNYWSGSKTPSGGSELRSGMTVGTSNFIITCSKNGVSNATASVNVSVVPAPTGSITASNCIISPGENKCNTTLVWNTFNPIVTSEVTTPINQTVAKGNSNTSIVSGKNTYSIDYGIARTFYLYNNGEPPLAIASATASCGQVWDTVSGSCVTVPTLNNTTISNILAQSAKLGATVTSLGIPASIAARGVCFSEIQNPSLENGAICPKDGNNTTTGAFSINTGSLLKPETTYYYRGYATNIAGTGYTAQDSFTTTKLPLPPDTTFTLSTEKIDLGKAVTLTWSSPSAEFCFMTSEPSPSVDISKLNPTTNNHMTLKPTQTTVYHLTCSQEGVETKLNRNVVVGKINPKFNEY